MTIELYHNNMSVCAQKVRSSLAHKSIAYVGHEMNLRAGETHTTAYLALNPKGKVPTLVVDGRPIVESTVICEYIDDAFPEKPLRPVDALALSDMRQWTLRPDAGVHLACSILSFAVAFRHQDTAGQMANRKSNPLSPAVRDVLEHGLQSVELPAQVRVFNNLLKDMAERLEQSNWLVGDEVSLADYAMLPYVLRLKDLGQSWLWQEVPGRIQIQDWVDRCAQEPGFKGISDNLEPTYLELMGEKGREAVPALREIFAKIG